MNMHQDIVDGINDPTIAAEQSYRRGYMQGVAAAIRAVKARKTVSQMEDWLYDELIQWRYHRHKGVAEPPKEIA